MTYKEQYFENVKTIVSTIQAEESESIATAGKKIAESTAQGGIVHLFGSGHSVLASLETYIRAGAFSNSKPVIQEMGIDRYERLPGIGKTIISKYDGQPGEVLIIFSNSGKNPLPIEIAQGAKEKGMFTIGISSKQHSQKVQTGQPKLADLVDLSIDTHVPYGDASVTLDGTNLKTGPLSTLANVTILHAIFCEAAEVLMADGELPPVRISRNTPEGDAYNRRFIEKYASRIPELKY